MTREKTLFIIAILIMIAPHLGLTNLMEQIALFVFGLIILIFAYGMYFEKRNRASKTSAKKKLSTVEHQTPLKREVLSPETGFSVVKKKDERSEENNFTI